MKPSCVDPMTLLWDAGHKHSLPLVLVLTSVTVIWIFLMKTPTIKPYLSAVPAEWLCVLRCRDWSKLSWTLGQTVFTDESDDLYLVSEGGIIILCYRCTKVILAFSAVSWTGLPLPMFFFLLLLFVSFNPGEIIDRKRFTSLTFFSQEW